MGLQEYRKYYTAENSERKQQNSFERQDKATKLVNKEIQKEIKTIDVMHQESTEKLNKINYHRKDRKKKGGNIPTKKDCR